MRGYMHVRMIACFFGRITLIKKNAQHAKLQDTTVKGKGKKIPHKVLQYFPIKSRLQRLFMSKDIAKDMRWHKDGCQDDGNLRHPTYSILWKEFDKEHVQFARDSRNVRLGLASDGFNPFGNISTPYSMWPVVLMPYNLPP
jgi:hypothetical protein